MNDTTQIALFELFERQKQQWFAEMSTLPQQVFDPEWRSSCEVGDQSNDSIEWQPILRDKSTNLTNIEEALEIKLHETISPFFCSYYADIIPCYFEEHPIELIQVWNEDDFKILQENMIAHFMMQKRIGQPASMFIASCSDEMQLISVINETGQVQLENLGKGTERILAESLPEFIQKLVPYIADK